MISAALALVHSSASAQGTSGPGTTQFPERTAPERQPLAGDRPDVAGAGLTGTWADWYEALGERGITPGFAWIVDTSNVASGGVRNRTTTRNLWAASIELDMDKLVGVSGGRFFAEYQSHAGRDATEDVGAFQAITNIDADRSIHAIARIWYEQNLFDDALRVKVGKIDANSDFALRATAASSCCRAPRSVRRFSGCRRTRTPRSASMRSSSRTKVSTWARGCSTVPRSTERTPVRPARTNSSRSPANAF